MRLQHLNQLISKQIEKSEVPKTELARRIGVSVQTFNNRYKSGNLEWEEMQALRLFIPKKDFEKAFQKDLGVSLKIMGRAI